MLRPHYAARLIAVIWLVTGHRLRNPWMDCRSGVVRPVWLAFWWALQTITTVGYGDVVPNDTDGKVVGAILMLGGLSLISVITAVVTSAFSSRGAQAELQAAGEDPVMQELKQIAARLERMEAELRRSASDDPELINWAFRTMKMAHTMMLMSSYRVHPVAHLGHRLNGPPAKDRDTRGGVAPRSGS